jgi:hypothetical protein
MNNHLFKKLLKIINKIRTLKIKIMKEKGLQKKTVLRAPRKQDFNSTLNTLKVIQRTGEIKHYFYVRIILIISEIVSLASGIFILVNFDDYLQVEFDHHNLLLFFIYIYGASAIGIFIIATFVSLLIYLFYCCFEKEKIYGKNLYDEEEQTVIMEGFKKQFTGDNEKTESVDVSKESIVEQKDAYLVQTGETEYIGFNADKVTLFPYMVTIYVILTIFFYFVALPLSIILLVNIWDHPDYRDKAEYWALYVFVFSNLVKGVLIIIVFIHMFCVKRIENNILQKNMELNEDKITELRNEVVKAIKNAH